MPREDPELTEAPDATIRRACVVAVGSELLGTRRVDTNSLEIAGVLEEHGIDLVAKSVIGDDVERLAGELRHRLEEVDLLVTTGGLGPTTDDATRDAVARALGRDTHEDPEVVEHIRRLFASFEREMPEVNRRQAQVIEGAEVLRNDRGTAPGLRLEHRRAEGGTATIFLFPGVPRELRALMERHLRPWLERAVGGDRRLEERVLKVASLPESTVEERIAPAYERFGAERIAVLASPGDIKVHYRAVGSEEERREILGPMEEELRRLLGPAVYADRAEDTLEVVVGRLLGNAGRTVVTAESCTGGWIGKRFTDVPGSSAYYLGGVVSYTNELKRQLLGVPAEILAAHGAVSEETCRAMARGARERLGADYALAVTGIAGPGGGSEEKPVGLVYVGVAGPDDADDDADDEGADQGDDGEQVEVRRVKFPGERDRVRRLTGQFALELLRRRLLLA